MRRYTYIGEPKIIPSFICILFFSLAYNDVKRLHFLLDCVVCHLYLSSIYECDECVSHFSNFSLKILMSITIIQ